MSKRRYIQRYWVTLPDGSETEVCCGPSIPPRVRFIQTIGEPTWGTCCHHIPPNLNEPIIVLIETNELQAGLLKLETLETIKDKLVNKWATPNTKT